MLNQIQPQAPLMSFQCAANVFAIFPARFLTLAKARCGPSRGTRVLAGRGAPAAVLRAVSGECELLISPPATAPAVRDLTQTHGTLVLPVASLPLRPYSPFEPEDFYFHQALTGSHIDRYLKAVFLQRTFLTAALTACPGPSASAKAQPSLVTQELPHL